MKEGFLWLLWAVTGACLFGLVQELDSRLSKERRTLCGAPTPVRSLFVKCAGGVGFVCCGLRFGTGANGLLSLPGLLAFFYLCILFLAALADLEARRIYDRLQAGIVLVGLLSLRLDMGHTLTERLIGVFAVSLPMLLLSLAALGAFGGGDIKLMASSGFFLGWRGIIVAIVLGLFSGGCCALIQLLRKKAGVKDQMAFGPFLAIGLAAALFWGDRLADLWLSAP